ncbi:MAG TPA: DUF1549 domain-containing protein [Thermoanaerobaculia bacterium]|nr:DUF1549 domain-containing protein [Thermoanaerobaculia bacterium]
MASPDERRAGIYRAASANAELVANATASRRRGAAAPVGPLAPQIPQVNFIDTHIFAKMSRDRVIPTSLASDEQFLRRVTLDLTGVIPDSATVTAFVADKAVNKRTKKIDELLASDAFGDRWTMWLGDLVQNVSAATNVRLYYQGRNAYYMFLKDAIRNGKPYDQIVRELIAGKGDSWATGAPNYAARQLQNNGPVQDTYDNLAAHSGEKFLAMPINCLSCHDGFRHLEQVNSGLASRKRREFWAMAAFFAKTQIRIIRNVDPNNPNIRKYDVVDNPTGNYRLNTTAGNKSPRAPMAGQSDVVSAAYMFNGEAPRAGELSRDAYGRILTADRQFARASVNYLWKEMFGLGIVEPLNAFDLARLVPSTLPAGSTVQPTHPELLEELATSFISEGYNLKSILRTMANSSSYQLSAQYTSGTWNEAWVPYFARRYPKRLQAEAVLDSVVKATGVGITMPVLGLGNVTKAMALPDSVEPIRRAEGSFLNQFGRGDRDDIMRTSDSSISQALSVMNDSLVTTRVRQTTPGSTMAKVLASTQDPGSITDQLYLATLSRSPTAAERQQGIDFLRSGNLTQRSEDLQWVLLNSLEFLFY